MFMLFVVLKVLIIYYYFRFLFHRKSRLKFLGNRIKDIKYFVKNLFVLEKNPFVLEKNPLLCSVILYAIDFCGKMSPFHAFSWHVMNEKQSSD